MGTYSVDEFVIWKEGESFRGGLAKAFAMCDASTGHGETTPIIVVDEHACTSDADTLMLFRQPNKVTLLHASKCLTSLPYIDNGADGYQVLKPRCFRTLMA